MLRFLKKLWNWLKSLFGWTGLSHKERENTPVTTGGRLKGWLYARDFNDKQLARWIGRKGQEWLQHPQDYQQLGRDLQELALVATGELGEAAQLISQQLARIFSTNLMSKEIAIWQLLSPSAQK